MPIRCPDCGRDNRDSAHFCVGCGRRGLQTLMPPAPSPQPLAHQPPAQPLAPQQPALLAPQQPALLVPQSPPALADQPLARSRRRRFGGPSLEGVIESCDQDEVYPPTDRALLLTKLGLGAAVLPAALYALTGAGVIAIVIIVLGGGACLAVLGAVFGAFAKLVSLFAPRRRPQDRKTTQVSLVVQAEDGAQSAAVLYGDHIAGMLHKGDRVAVYGRRQRNGVIRARRVEVVGAAYAPGAVARRVVTGRRALPAVVAIGAWGAALAAWALVYVPLLLRVMR